MYQPPNPKVHYVFLDCVLSNNAEVSAGKEILIRVVSAGINPTDWKHADMLSKPGVIIGCDAAGIVDELGPDADPKEVQKGQRRGFFIRGGTNDRAGAFAEYCVAEYDLTFLIPDNLSFDAAASIPIPFFTAVQALYRRLKLPEPTPMDPIGTTATEKEPFLIWGGATSVGQYAIQLARLSKRKVFTTASPDNWGLVKTLGAEDVQDYKDPDAPIKIKRDSSNGIKVAMDCVCDQGSTEKIEMAMSDDQGGYVVTILFPDPKKMPRKDIQILWTLVYTALGGEHSFGDAHFTANAEDREHHARWCKVAPEFFARRLVKTLPLVDGGVLEDVQKDFDLMKSGKHRAGKIVVHIGSPNI
jgi:NADPH:quinone reductase-like Zn-dependent oxidoreductase